MEISTRNCTLKDFAAVLQLLYQLWPERKLDENKLFNVFKRGLRSRNQKYLKAVHKGRIVGFCSLGRLNTLYGNGESMHIDELVIDENFRNLGIGKMMLDKTIEISIEEGCKTVELESAIHRNDAHRFYENLGFEKLGVVFLLKIPDKGFGN
jgi:glucosamine-phosphate N-acetyltransferase